MHNTSYLYHPNQKSIKKVTHPKCHHQNVTTISQLSTFQMLLSTDRRMASPLPAPPKSSMSVKTGPHDRRTY